MKKILLILCWGLMPLLSWGQTGYGRASLWEKDMEAFKQADAKQFPEKESILFVGSSSFKGWVTLGEDFPEYNVINRAFGGSVLSDLIYFFHTVVSPYAPSQIIVYEGDNDIAGGITPEAYLEDVITFVRMVDIFLPGTPVDFLSIKPSPARQKWTPQYRKANQLVCQWAASKPQVRFIDVAQLMVGRRDEIHSDYFLQDKLHLNKKGYQLWASVVRPYLLDKGKKQ